MKIAILNDTHCGARNSAEWMIDYQERFYRDVFFPYIDATGIDTIIHAGDYYESRKTAASVLAQQSNKMFFIDEVNKRDIDFRIIPGNHDVFYKNSNHVSSVSVLLEDKNFTVFDEPITLNFDGTQICLIPWINNENVEAVKKEIKKTKAKICIGHFEFAGFAFAKGGTPCQQSIGVEPEELAKFDMVLSGHFHTKSTKGNITYLGSQYEFTWADCDDPKFFHVLDTETGMLEAIRNPLTMFKRVVYKPGMEVSDDCKNKFIQVIKSEETGPDYEEYLDELVKVALDVKVQDLTKRVASEENQEEITDNLTLIQQYVKEADLSGLDAERLTNMMETLYKRAMDE